MELFGFWSANPADNDGVGVPLDAQYAWEEGVQYDLFDPSLKEGVKPMGRKLLRGLGNTFLGIAELPGQILKGKREGRLFWPTVLTDTRSSMKVMCKEAFAPLVSLIRYDDFDEALRLLDDTPYGLQAGLYTRDLHKAFEAVRRIDVGGLMVNDTSIFRVDHMPYGGNRMSGIGREGVRFAIEEMTNIRLVCFNLNE